jgi:hypothetical protein
MSEQGFRIEAPELQLPVAVLSAVELEELRWAYRHLEHPSLAARLSAALGAPIEQGLKLLPAHWYARLRRLTERSVRKGLDVAVSSMDRIPSAPGNDRVHKLMAAGTGAVGGFFGPLALAAELPVTTTLMLRAIADIADREGEDLSQAEARFACLQVFALGGRTHDDDAADTGYYGLRLTLALHFEDVLAFAANSNAPTIPAAINLVRAIAARFGIVISDKAAAQLVPIAGALGGAAVNLMFMQHFQDVAKGHFIVRRLERCHGTDVIRSAYRRLGREEAAQVRDYSPVEGW